MIGKRDTTVTGAAAITSSGFLGQSGAWWEFWLVIALVVTVLAAGAVGVTAAGSIVARKREALAAGAALVEFKLESDTDFRHLDAEMAEKVAEATTAGIRAGEAAAAARADLLAAQVEIARQKTIAAAWEKDAAGARLDTERLRQQLAWRALSAEQMTALIHSLSDSHLSLSLLAASDPETIELGHQLLRGFKDAGVKVTSAKRLLDPPIDTSDAIVSGEEPETGIVTKALEAAGLTVCHRPSTMALKVTILPKPRA
jgi:hypothetical protein